MRKITDKKPIIPVLDDLLNDGRLTRLFSKDDHNCALQLWVLQIKSKQSLENRIFYGRLLPYSYSNEEWSFSDNDKFHPLAQAKAKITRLNLYIKSVYCEELLRQLSAGQTISEISEKLTLRLSSKLKKLFGNTALSTDDLVYRPVAYLFNRDAHDRQAPSSPHCGAGAFSASITQANKGTLFRLGQDYDVDLTELVVKHLNEDTGLEFGGVDAARFGDIELLVFPALDDLERPLLNVNWADDSFALIVRFNPMQLPYFSSFQFRLCITNDSQVVYSSIAKAEPDAENMFDCKFELDESLQAIADSTELEIFGFRGDNSRTGTLCCRWRVYYFREIHSQGHVVGHGASPVKFDWLEKTTQSRDPARVKAALTINHGNLGYSNLIGRRNDPWAPANRDLASLFARLHPPKSECRFFLRWGQSDGEGRLQFVEWFKALLAKYQQCQMVIFDPYFEDVGLGLLFICAAEKADYIVFRSLPKSTREEKLMRRKSDNTVRDGINNLLANCEQNCQRMKWVKLRIYGLKEGRLHDRYILIMGQDSLPVAGFHLSNSFQYAAENYPLLVTPIPSDVLLKVEQYKSELLEEAAQAVQLAGKITNPTMQLLFDSAVSSTARPRYEPLRFLEKTQAGNVLSAWTGELSLQGLSGDFLKERMALLGLLTDNSLALPETAGLKNCLDQQADDIANFTITWDVLGDMLAHSRFGDYRFPELESERKFMELLSQFLQVSFDSALDELGGELAVIDAKFFRKSLTALLHGPYHLHHLSHPTKYTALTWPEFFAIKFLWWYAPDALLAIAEVQMAVVPEEPQGSDAMRLSLLSQIVSEISLSAQFEMSEVQRSLLVRSSNGLLQWIGLNAIEIELEKPGGLANVLGLVAGFTYPERVRTLGWMINHAAKNDKKADIYKGLVDALHATLPEKVLVDELKRLIDSLRGHMQQLSWAEPWLFQDVIFPLLQKDLANTDDVCEIWAQELSGMLEPQQNDPTLLFNREREGQTTNITAFLFAYSSDERQKVTLNLMQAILKKQRQIVQQPLASTSNWARWDTALTVSLWILAFSKWAEYYLHQRGMNDNELERLSRDAQEVAMVRHMDEWCSGGVGKWGELAKFLGQVEELLSSREQ
ncbi:VPA1262 family protein [Methylomonas methanica]|uniref:Uncharacterized protein n=1 Tax=Methylomonas methanica TaxID=421 RepID=A0A177MYW3_METMH|nr:VPA1262 family protein [Methylomonas methanica]OAI10775.1 hypothetical protein A1332_23605 [Methylomonas methanica]